MFVCEKCLNGRGEFYFSRSYGPCEICGKTSTCQDIPHWYSLDDKTDDYCKCENEGWTKKKGVVVCRNCMKPIKNLNQ